jgi:hypothetical protein
MRKPMNLSLLGRSGQIGGVLCDGAALRENYRSMISTAFCHHSNLCWFRNLFHGRTVFAPRSSQKNFFSLSLKKLGIFLNKVLIAGAARRGFEVSDAKLTET